MTLDVSSESTGETPNVSIVSLDGFFPVLSHSALMAAAISS